VGDDAARGMVKYVSNDGKPVSELTGLLNKYWFIEHILGNIE
jgi:hypothetical protein